MVSVDVPEGSPSIAEVALSELQLWGLACRGLVGLSGAPGMPPCFREVPSVAQPRSFGDTPAGLAANFNDFLGCQISYQFIASRLAHCVRLFHHRDGDVTDPPALAERTQSWLYQYVHDAAVATPASRGKHPFRSAEIEVAPTSDGARWLLRVSPMYRYQGDVEPFLEGMRFFTLSVSGAFV